MSYESFDKMFSLFVVIEGTLGEASSVVPTSSGSDCQWSSLSISYRMTQDPLCSSPAQYSPDTASSRTNLLGSSYGNHKGAPSIIESVMPIDLSKQGIRNQKSLVDYHVTKCRTRRSDTKSCYYIVNFLSPPLDCSLGWCSRIFS